MTNSKVNSKRKYTKKEKPYYDVGDSVAILYAYKRNKIGFITKRELWYSYYEYKIHISDTQFRHERIRTHRTVLTEKVLDFYKEVFYEDED